MEQLFQSTLPARGATNCKRISVTLGIFQSTLPARGATSAVVRGVIAVAISIHAPRTGSDGGTTALGIVPCLFQSTLPARGATRTPSSGGKPAVRFQSTLPARGATKPPPPRATAEAISIHAPRTGSDFACCLLSQGVIFQSTLPARGATCPPGGGTPPTTFQSTLPARGATAKRSFALCAAAYFNPRSPHGERLDLARTPWEDDFNPRSPHGERHPADGHGCRRHTNFNPRSPHGERPTARWFSFYDMDISIHAPRTGSDLQGLLPQAAARDFNPRSPHGERPSRDTAKFPNQDFNPRSPHGERLHNQVAQTQRAQISIHAPRTGSDLTRAGTEPAETRISIHAPRTGSDRAK